MFDCKIYNIGFNSNRFKTLRPKSNVLTCKQTKIYGVDLTDILTNFAIK